jgi:poly(A) polymerase
LKDVPPARLFDELLKLFHGGHAARSFDVLRDYDLLRYLFRDTQAVLETPDGEKIAGFIRRGLENTDARIREDKPVTPTFLYAVFLWFPIKALAEKLEREGWQSGQAMLEASQRIVASQQTAFPRRFSSPMKELLAMQWRFTQRQGARAARMLQHKRFRAAYDFLLLRASLGEVDQETVTWWTDIQALPPEEQGKMLGGKGRSGRRRRGGRRRSGQSEITDVVS